MGNNLRIRNVAGLPDAVDVDMDLIPPEDLDYYHFTTKCMFNSTRRDGYIGLPTITAYLVDGERVRGVVAQPSERRVRRKKSIHQEW